MTRKKKLNLSIYKQRDTVYFKNLTKDFKSKVLSFFYMNVCSLIKNFDNFNILLSELNVSFHILAITETTLKKDSSSPINLQLSNYSIEHSPTEKSAGETLLYISKRLSSQLRNDLSLYDPGKIEQNFIKNICSKSTNVIVGHIYKQNILTSYK